MKMDRQAQSQLVIHRSGYQRDGHKGPGGGMVEAMLRCDGP